MKIKTIDSFFRMINNRFPDIRMAQLSAILFILVLLFVLIFSITIYINYEDYVEYDENKYKKYIPKHSRSRR